MLVIYVVLAGVTVVAFLGHMGMWFWAYQEVKNIESWSQQARALDRWWIFDKSLLPKEQDHLRVTALWCAIVVGISGGLFWYLLKSVG